MKKLFYKDNIDNIEVSYDTMFDDISAEDTYYYYCKSNSYYSVFKHIIISLLLGEKITLLDNDFSDEEINTLVGSNCNINSSKSFKKIGKLNFEDIKDIIQANKNTWEITLFTSGTTGQPKKIIHSYDSLSRFIKLDNTRKENIWGFAYNPTHMAGLQVFFQAFFNHNTIIRIFGESRENTLELIKNFRITNISATPTFYRLLLPSDTICDSVKNLSSGGEKFDSRTIQNLNKMFPNCRIRNIYASTEAGVLFASDGEVFSVNEEISHLIKFINNELYIHGSLMGQSDGLNLKEGWYQTGDLIEIINPKTFRFVSRKSEIINTGGYKVNPTEVEDVIRLCNGVGDVLVYGKKNSILGNVVVCDIVRLDELITEKQIRLFLKEKLQEFKIPRVIKFVECLETTRTGKITRK